MAFANPSRAPGEKIESDADVTTQIEPPSHENRRGDPMDRAVAATPREPDCAGPSRAEQHGNTDRTIKKDARPAPSTDHPPA